ncbi:MAG: hypothetical protein LBP59_02870 [Planctomycetaceae bacterium]|nr:hypothetical protein [Planctomycetaceae bacterium]
MTIRILSLTFAVMLVFTFAATTIVLADDAKEPAAATTAPAVKPACPHCQAVATVGCCEVAPTVIYRRTWFGLGSYYKPVLVYPACAPAPVYRAYPVVAPAPVYRAYPVVAPRCYYPAYPVYPACCW